MAVGGAARGRHPRAALRRAWRVRGVDERGFEMARRIRQAHDDMPLSDFKALVREQFNMLLIDQDAALRAIPAMLPADAKTRSKALDLISQILRARGALSEEDTTRLSEIAKLFGGEEGNSNSSKVSQLRKERQAGAS